MNSKSHQNFQNLLFGADTPVPLLDGTYQRYINLDNAASTPPLKAVVKSIQSFLPYYSSVHRGTGFKSQLSTHAYEQSRIEVMKFLGADPTQHVCIFGKNTTEAINKLAHRFKFSDQHYVVITSGMEHHSNDLPWRGIAKTVHVKLTAEGKLDEQNFDDMLETYAGHIALVAITGASNVTGYINPIHRLAEKTHRAGAIILVDCAQLAPHRKINMLPLDDPAHLDLVAISAHKMYAPFGTGALIGRRDIFETGDPDMRGGGTVEIVTLDEVIWAEPPERDEAGSPNTVGAIALAVAINQLTEIGMENVAAHEAELTNHALQQLLELEKVNIYGDSDPSRSSERLGVIPFSLQGISHFKAASILGYEYGIGVRSGCFCAHPYILHLLGLTSEQTNSVRQQILANDRSDMPGFIRVSFGLYNTVEDVESFRNALDMIIRGKYKGKYLQDKTTGEYIPEGWQPAFNHYLEW